MRSTRSNGNLASKIQSTTLRHCARIAEPGRLTARLQACATNSSHEAPSPVATHAVAAIRMDSTSSESLTRSNPPTTSRTCSPNSATARLPDMRTSRLRSLSSKSRVAIAFVCSIRAKLARSTCPACSRARESSSLAAIATLRVNSSEVTPRMPTMASRAALRASARVDTKEASNRRSTSLSEGNLKASSLVTRSSNSSPSRQDQSALLHACQRSSSYSATASPSRNRSLSSLLLALANSSME